MKPYYEENGITIYHGDCREVLPSLEPFDCLVTDPPYLNLTGGYSYPDIKGVAKKTNESIGLGDVWDANLEWVESAKLLTNLGAVVFCSYHSLPEIALAFSDMRRAVLWSWHKRNAPTQGKNVPRFTEEYAWGFAKKPGLKWDAIKSTLIDVPKLATGCCTNKERFVDDNQMAVHPTQKPMAVMRQVLKIVPVGCSICDPFMGTGSTLEVAKGLGLQAIGIEIEEKYCEIAANRLRQEVLQFEVA